MDELLDLLDENGKVVGTVYKGQAHLDGSWHRAVHVYLIDSKREILMQLRTSDKTIGPNMWDIAVGGHVGAGESTIDAALRETQEELGLKFNKKDVKFCMTNKEVLTNGKYISREFVDVFLINKDIDQSKIKLQKEEVAGFKFISFDDFIQKVKKRDKQWCFHYDEYMKMITVLEKTFDKTK